MRAFLETRNRVIGSKKSHERLDSLGAHGKVAVDIRGWLPGTWHLGLCFLPVGPYFLSANYPFPIRSLFGLVELTPPMVDLGFPLI